MLRIWLIVLIIIPVIAYTDYKPEVGKSYVESEGRAILEVVPDEIKIGIRITEEDNDSDKIKQLEDKVVAIVKRNGLDPNKSLKVVDINSYYRAGLFSDDSYISKNYELLVDNATIATKIISEVNSEVYLDAKVNEITHTKIDSLRREVRIMAIKAAKEKAEYLTEAIGQKLGKAFWFETDNSSMYANHFGGIVNTTGRANNSKLEEQQSLEFKKIQLKNTITVYFEFE